MKVPLQGDGKTLDRARPLTVEVLIPAYNAAATLAATLRSVQRQTIPIPSVTVVDDCSTDRTPEIVRQFPFARYVRNEKNLGMGRNLNRCFEMSTGDLVSLLSADDLLAPDWHAKCLEGAALCPGDEAYCLYLGTVWFSHASRKARGLFSFAGEVKRYEPGALLKLLWERCFYGVSASACVVYPRQVLQRYGLYPIDEYPNMADVPYHWKLLTEIPFVYDPAYSVLVRTGAPGQVSQGKAREFACGALKAFRAALPSVATRLGVHPQRLEAEYLFPYWLGMQAKRVLRKDHYLPLEVRASIDAAVRGLGAAGVATVAWRFFWEQVRRRHQMVLDGRRAAALIADLDQSESVCAEMAKVETPS